MIGIPNSFLNSGDAPSIGVRYFPATNDCPPVRLYYPSVNNDDASPVRWFQGDSSSSFLKGYVHMLLGLVAPTAKHGTWKFKWLVGPLTRFVSWFLPMTWLRIPGVYKDVSLFPLSQTMTSEGTTISSSSSSNVGGLRSLPAIIFSHGLTGTGQENAVFCAAWAKQGFIVASVHHLDGSSCCVKRPDGTDLYYVHGPSFKNYDPTFRPNQVNQRAEEMLQVRNFLLRSPPSQSTEQDDDDCLFLASIRARIEPQRIVAAGFSFGAASAAAAISLCNNRQSKEQQFCAGIFLDGWFHIDVVESAGIEFNFPQQAFDKHSGASKISHIPSLYINSEQFRNIPKLYAATKTLAGKNDTSTTETRANEIHTIAGSIHQNFSDVIFWLPTAILKRIGMIGKYADPIAAYKEVIMLSVAFLRCHVAEGGD